MIVLRQTSIPIRSNRYVQFLQAQAARYTRPMQYPAPTFQEYNPCDVSVIEAPGSPTDR